MFRWPLGVPAFGRLGGGGSGGGPGAPALAAPRLDDQVLRVGGRAAGVGIADGGGSTVLFLHGWGLTHRSYSGPIEALAAEGYRVVAPDLPGFGRTADLPADRRSFAGFAAFLDELLGEMGDADAVHVVGHSFGGGVATQFAHDYPKRVRSLVLVDAVSGATWSRAGEDARLLAARPMWDWALHLLLELPVGSAPRAVPSLLGELASNLVRHPASLGQVALLICRSDLRAELAALHERRLPVTVIWGAGDRVVPRAAYEDLCAALDAAGETVPGTHSWPISAPGRFAGAVGAALAAVEDTRAAS